MHVAGGAARVLSLSGGGRSRSHRLPSYKYLGVELHSGVPFRMFRARMIASATRASNAVSAMGMYSGKLSVPLGVQVDQAMVRSLLEYCSPAPGVHAGVRSE